MLARTWHTQAVPVADLVSNGLAGLRLAAARFDPSKGTRFSTVASTWVGQHIARSRCGEGGRGEDGEGGGGAVAHSFYWREQEAHFECISAIGCRAVTVTVAQLFITVVSYNVEHDNVRLGARVASACERVWLILAAIRVHSTSAGAQAPQPTDTSCIELC